MIEDTVYESGTFIIAVSPRDFHCFVYAYLRRNLRIVKYLECSQPKDVTIHAAHAFDTPMLTRRGYLLIQLLDVIQHSSNHFLRAGSYILFRRLVVPETPNRLDIRLTLNVEHIKSF
jgi:hypothetical protein